MCVWVWVYQVTLGRCFRGSSRCFRGSSGGRPASSSHSPVYPAPLRPLGPVEASSGVRWRGQRRGIHRGEAEGSKQVPGSARRAGLLCGRTERAGPVFGPCVIHEFGHSKPTRSLLSHSVPRLSTGGRSSSPCDGLLGGGALLESDSGSNVIKTLEDFGPLGPNLWKILFAS